jgi:hypothetical protein
MSEKLDASATGYDVKVSSTDPEHPAEFIPGILA